MSAKSTAGSKVKRGEIAVPEQVFNLLLIASGARLPDREHASVASAVAKRLGGMVRRHHASAKRLRDSFAWTPEEARVPCFVIIDRNFYVVPHGRRFEKGATLEKIAVPLHSRQGMSVPGSSLIGSSSWASLNPSSQSAQRWDRVSW